MKTAASLLTSVYLLTLASPAFAASVSSEISLEPYAIAMAYAESANILEPLSDGLMHSEMPISRKDMVMSVVRDVYKTDVRDDCFDRIASKDSRFTFLFTDIPRADAGAKEICVGMLVGIVDGRADGSFATYQGANLVEAAKVVTKAYGIAPLPSLRKQTGVPWHEPYWFGLARKNAIPETVKSRDATLTRGEFAEILYRLREERPAQGFRYHSTFVRDIAQEPAVEQIVTSPPHAPELLLNPASVVTTIDTRGLSAGLIIQVHAEARKNIRLQEQARTAGMGLENNHADRS